MNEVFGLARVYSKIFYTIALARDRFLPLENFLIRIRMAFIYNFRKIFLNFSVSKGHLLIVYMKALNIRKSKLLRCHLFNITLYIVILYRTVLYRIVSQCIGMSVIERSV